MYVKQSHLNVSHTVEVLDPQHPGVGGEHHHHPHGEHEEGGRDEEREPEPEQHVELLVDHVEGEHADSSVLVLTSRCSEPVYANVMFYS